MEYKLWGLGSTLDEMSMTLTTKLGDLAATFFTLQYSRPQLPDSTQTNRLYIFSPSFAAGINKHANQSSESQPGRVVKAVPEIQKSISLASLLDSHNRGRDLSPANQSSGDDDSMMKKRKKKKRRGLRM